MGKIAKVFLTVIVFLQMALLAQGATITATSGGRWGQGNNWSGGSVPAPGDDVVIPTGISITIDDDYQCRSVSLTGTLEFANSGKGSLTLSGNLTVNANGVLQVVASGSNKVSQLYVSGNVTNSGTMNLSNGTSAMAQLIFTGTANAGFTMNSGSVNDFGIDSGIVINKSLSTALVTATLNGTFTVNGTSTTAFLDLNSGILSIEGSSSITNPIISPTYYSIPSGAGLRINNPNCNMTGIAQPLINNGSFRVSLGSATVGTATGNFLSGTGAVTVDGGTLHLASGFSTTTGSFTLSSGTVNVCTVANASSSPSFDLPSGSSFTLSGGAINLVQASTNATPLDYRVLSSTLSITGGQLNVGSSATATNFSFRVAGALPTLTTNATTNNKNAILSGVATGYGTITVSTGTSFSTNGFSLSHRGASFVNNGTVSGSGTISFDAASAQAYSGTGSFTSNLTDNNATGLTLSNNLNFGNSSTLTVSSGAILVGGVNTISFGTGGAATINGIFRTANGAGFSGGGTTAVSNSNSPAITLGASSTIDYNATGAQTISARTDYANLTVSAARGGGLITLASGTIGVSGTFSLTASSASYSVAGNTFNYKGSSQPIVVFNYNNLDLTGATAPVLPFGTIGVAGTFTPGSLSSAAQGTINFNGSNQTVPAFNYNNLDLSSSGNLGFPAGTVGISGTFTPASISSATQGTINFRGNSQTVPAFNYNNLDLTGASSTGFSTGTVGISGTFTPASITAAAQGTINFRGNNQTVPAFNYFNLDLTGATNTSFPAGTVGVAAAFTPGTITTATQGTINFRGSSQTVPAFNYFNLSLSGATGTTFSSGVAGISGTFTTGSITGVTQGTINFRGATQTVPAFNYNNLDLTGATGTTFSTGTAGVSGTFTPASITAATQGTINFRGSNQTVPAFNYFNLDLTGASGTGFSTGVAGVSGTFTPASITSATQGTINFRGSGQTVPSFIYYNLDLTGATGTSFANATVSIANNFVPGALTSIAQGTVSYVGSAQNVAAINYYNLDLNGSGTKTFTAGQNLVISNNLSVVASANLGLSAATPTTLTIANGLSYNATSGGTNIGSITLYLTSASGTISGGNSVVTPNITIASAASRTLASNFSISAARTFQLDGTLVTSGYALSGAGNTTISGTGRVFLSNASGLSGAVTSTGTRSFAAGAQYYYNGSGAQSTGFSGLSMGNPGLISVTNTAAEVTLDADVTMNAGGALNVGSGASFNAGARVISFGTSGTATISGTFTTTNLNGLSGQPGSAIASANNPSVTLASGSTIVYAAAGQVMTGRTDYHHVTVSNGNKTLNGAAALAGNLSFSGGSKLTIGNNNLSVAGQMSGADASNFVVTDGSGAVTLRSVSGSGKQFHIGASASSYSPFTVAQSSGLDWTVRVAASVTPAPVNPADAIQRTWVITPSVNPAPSGATITFQYNEADAGIQGANWSTSGTVTLNRHNGTRWTTMVTGLTPTGTAGGIRTVSTSGITQFSPWVISKGSSPLPVRFLSFTGERSGGANKLRWQTATEADNAGFDVERSTDGVRFEKVATVASAAAGGNSTSVLSYSYNDIPSAAVNYYRIRQRDLSGGYSFSGTIRLQAGDIALGIAGLYPNPATDAVQLSLNADLARKAQLGVYDMQGRLLQVKNLSLERGTNPVRLDVQGLPSGTYVLQLSFEDGQHFSQRFSRR